MKPLKLMSYAEGRWLEPAGALNDIVFAVSDEPVAQLGIDARDFAGMLNHARNVGGPALRVLTFHQRARMLKSLAEAIMARKDEMDELSYETRATRSDGWIDIEGGAG